jgi:hypothetical protein
MMGINESHNDLQQLFDNFMKQTYPELNEPKITKHKTDVWIDDENGDLMFTYFPLHNEPGKYAITHVDDNLKDILQGMFGEYSDELLKNWFKHKFNLHVDYILE